MYLVAQLREHLARLEVSPPHVFYNSVRTALTMNLVRIWSSPSTSCLLKAKTNSSAIELSRQSCCHRSSAKCCE